MSSPSTRSQGARRDSARIEVTGLTKRFLTPSGAVFTALEDTTFTVEPGQFCAIVGPTGCGKSTTLGMVVRARPAQRGLGHGRREQVNGITPA